MSYPNGNQHERTGNLKWLGEQGNMNICAGMRGARLEQNAVLNTPGMHAMAKHLFSPCNRSGARCAGRPASHLPLKKENALV